MSTNSEDVDLGLALGLPSCSIGTRLNNNSSGAGVNANSRADLAFAASDPLSELVWSPRKGLSLKRANSAVADNKPFLLWNVGPSSNLLSPAQYIRTVDDNAVDQGNLSVTQTVLIDSSYMFGDKATSVQPSRTEGDSIMEEEVETGDAIQEEEDRRDARDEDLCHPENVQIAAIAEISKKTSGGLRTSANVVSDCNVDMTINGLFSAELIQKAHCSQSNSIEIYASGSGVVGLHVANPSEPIVTKLSEAPACSLLNFHFQKEPDDELTSATRQVTTDKPFYIPPPPLNNMVSSAEDDLCNPIAKQNPHLVEGSQKGSRICLDQEKGKGKALSDEGSSNDEDDSHESVKSCNSAGSFSKGVKRRSYDQGLVLESKRMKESIHGSPASASIARPGSSFMSWISNMVKGLSDSNKEDSSSLALTLACSYDVYGKYSPENFPNKKTNDSASLDMGFQTIFQSLSCRNPTVSNSQVEKENDSKEESRERVVADKTSLEDLPGSCDKNNSNSCEQIGLSNKEVNPVIVGQASKPWIFSAYIDCSPLACERILENKASEESNRFLSDSPSEEINSTAKGTTPEIPLAMSDVPEKSNPLNSLWITRFCTRAPRLEKCDEITRETNECTTYCPKVNPDRVVDDLMLIHQKSSEARDDFAGIERYDGNAEVTVDLKSPSKFCPIPPSEEIRSSEAMASPFARRVDALRHIGPSKGRNTSTSLVTCFFCGSGHDLRECPDVTKAELEDLLLKMRAFDRFEGSSCLCIRCSGSDHWAITCPLAPSSSHSRSKRNASSFPSHRTLNPKGYSSKRTESSFGNSVKTNPNSSPSKIVKAQDTVVLSEVFHAIKNLRLSRADILRWMNSDVSLSHLNGFFLRLRLGKLEAGLGEASYYVACIAGDAREHNGCTSKKSILVDVGGIRSSVGSQFVSNQDFLEDEIKAWWCRTVDSGRKIPSLDELNSKLNHRKILGF